MNEIIDYELLKGIKELICINLSWKLERVRLKPQM
jgi:hypothetical protein